MTRWIEYRCPGRGMTQAASGLELPLTTVPDWIRRAMPSLLAVYAVPEVTELTDLPIVGRSFVHLRWLRDGATEA